MNNKMIYAIMKLIMIKYSYKYFIINENYLNIYGYN